ncbi:hypothetical protein J1605_002724 [Eschrichtius robustus]|uniref:Uncharacterized protein n=1 Tax=Eschrichtius robustus TaxID=9764 RepID=A0AB34HSZ8_ESCRO|nr:hypothetical protein J1605_002724 [Eschrichtius robustus]
MDQAEAARPPRCFFLFPKLEQKLLSREAPVWDFMTPVAAGGSVCLVSRLRLADWNIQAQIVALVLISSFHSDEPISSSGMHAGSQPTFRVSVCHVEQKKARRHQQVLVARAVMKALFEEFKQTELSVTGRTSPGGSV